MRLLNLNSLDVLKALPSACIDLIVTDPPYKVTSRGNAGIACKRLGRCFVGIELDKTYFDIAQQRIME